MIKTKTIELDQFCKSILDTDKNILSVSIIDRKGKVLHSLPHNMPTQPSLDKWNNIHYMECVLDISLGTEFDELYGPIRYHHSDKDSLMMFSFPHNKYVVIITTTKMISPINFATNISKIITNNK